MTTADLIRRNRIATRWFLLIGFVYIGFIVGVAL